MKYLIILSLFLCSCASNKTEEKKQLTYWYADDKVSIVQKAMGQWKEVGINFARADESKSKLKILFVPQSKMYNPDYLGQYTKNKILINKEAGLNSLEYEHVIAHEVGHFLKLEHNKRPGSIMNINESLKTRVNKTDIEEAKKKNK